MPSDASVNAEPQIALGETNPVQISRDPSVGRQHHDGRRVRPLLRPFIPSVAEPYLVGQALRIALVVRQEMPSIAGISFIRFQVKLLLCPRQVELLFRIDADRHDLELFSGGPRQFAERSRLPVQHQVAKHRAAVVDEVQEDRLALREVLPKRNLVPVLGGELQIQIDLLTDMLDDVNADEFGRERIRPELPELARRPSPEVLLRNYLCAAAGG